VESTRPALATAWPCGSAASVAETLNSCTTAMGIGALADPRAVAARGEASLKVLQVQLGFSSAWQPWWNASGREPKCSMPACFRLKGKACLLAHLAVEQEIESRLPFRVASRCVGPCALRTRIHPRWKGQPTLTCKAIQVARKGTINWLNGHSRDGGFSRPDGSL